jgi:hypothetical protein
MMRSSAQVAFRRSIGVFFILLAVLVCSTWTAVKITTDRLLYQNATSAARDWARYLAENVTDLEQIAAGQQPSRASMAFFRSTGKPGQVFRPTGFGSRQRGTVRLVGVQSGSGAISEVRKARRRRQGRNAA